MQIPPGGLPCSAFTKETGDGGTLMEFRRDKSETLLLGFRFDKAFMDLSARGLDL